MSGSPEALLPPGARLLHIGPFKTGTTALQSAAAAHRDELLAAGTRYPGTGLNHRDETAALLGRQRRWHRDGPPGPEAWHALLAEIAQDDRRALISHEYLANLDDDDARRFLDSLGATTHVVITLRPLAAILPSDWQQQIKSGRRVPDLDVWLDRTLDRIESGGSSSEIQRRSDHGRLVTRWAALTASDRVTVVALDRDRPRLVFEAFEHLLGLPGGTLDPGDQDGASANRGLTLAEVALLREVGAWADERGFRPQDYSRWVTRGLVARLQSHYRPPADAARPAPSASTAQRMSALQRRFVAQIAASGVRVLGDPATLDPPSGPPGGVVGPVTDVPLEVAVEAVLGVLERARLPPVHEPALRGGVHAVLRTARRLVAR